ncbi:MAG: VWA domain-containing protein [Pseudomonadota bacterium]
MTFARPELLFLLWVVPALIMVFLFGSRRRRHILAKFARKRSLDAINPDVSPVRRRIKAVLVLTAAAAAAAALSGVLYGYSWETTHRRGVSLVVALDCSRSMLAEDVKPVRLERAKREIIDLLGMLQGDRVGLVAFAGTAFLHCPMTLDYSAFHLFLEALGPDYLPVGGTDLAGAVRTSIKAFDLKDPTDKAIILITDGEATTADALDAAREAAAQKIRIFSIGVGGPDGAPIPDGAGGFKKDNGKIILSRLDEETLQKMALATGGAYVRSVSGDMDLEAIYQNEIRGKMEAKELGQSRSRVFKDRYQWLVGLAVAALFVDLFLSSAKNAALVLALVLILGGGGPAWAGAAAEVKKGVEAYRKEDYQAALDAFLKAQTDDPDNPAVLYNLGAAYYKLNKFEEARRNFQEASKSRELKAKSLYNLGNSSFRQGSLEEAIAFYEQALKEDSRDHDAEKNIEYVKKLLEQQKQEQQNQDQNRDKPSDQQPQDQEQSSPQGGKDGQDKSSPREDAPGEGQRQESSSSEGGEGRDEGREGGTYADSIKRDQLPPPNEQGEDAPAATPGREGETEGEGRKPTVDAGMLNRLPDRIGPPPAAQYQERKVERDW